MPLHLEILSFFNFFCFNHLFCYLISNFKFAYGQIREKLPIKIRFDCTSNFVIKIKTKINALQFFIEFATTLKFKP